MSDITGILVVVVKNDCASQRKLLYAIQNLTDEELSP